MALDETLGCVLVHFLAISQPTLSVLVSPQNPAGGQLGRVPAIRPGGLGDLQIFQLVPGRFVGA